MQAEVLWIADSVGELTLGQALPLDNLSLMDYGVLGKLALSQGSAERGVYSLVCSTYHGAFLSLRLARQNFHPIPRAKALQDEGKGF